MALDPTEYIPVDGSDEPAFPDDAVLPQNATVLFTFPRVSQTVTPMTYKLTVSQLKGLFITDATALPVVRFVVPTSGSERPAGSQVLLQVTATDLAGIASVEFFINGTSIGFGVGTDNDYVLPYNLQGTPGSINIQAKALNINGRSSSVTSFLFIGPNAQNPRAPQFINQVDDAAGGTLQLVPVDNVPMADYRWKIGAQGTYVQVPSDGIISVGNVAGVVYAYSVASGNRTESPVTNSIPFTTAAYSPVVSFIAPVNGTTITGGTTVLLRVSASDPSGDNIISVRLYNGGTLIGSATPTGGNAWQIPYTIPVGNSTINLRAEAINEADVFTNVSCFIFVSAPAPTLTVPGAPVIGTATAGDSVATANWSAPSSNGGTTISSYKIYRASGGAVLGTVNGSTYTYADTTAVNGTAVAFKVTAVNSVGEGDLSASSNSVTPAAPIIVIPTYNTTLNPGDNISSVTWNAGSGTLLKLNLPLSTNPDPNPATMTVYAPDGTTQVGQADYSGFDTGVQGAVVYNGTSYLITLTNGNVTLV